MKKDDEIFHLKDHSKKFLAQIKKSKALQVKIGTWETRSQEIIQEQPIRKKWRKFSLKKS